MIWCRKGGAFRARLAAGEEDLVLAAVVDRLLARESPVRVWREHRGLTQSGLARAAGVHRVVVADIEACRRGGSVKSLKALPEALGAWGRTEHCGRIGWVDASPPFTVWVCLQ